MPLISSYDLDILDRFTVVVDQDAEPSDVYNALAEFLLKVVRKRRTAGTPATDSSILTFPEQ